MRGFTHHLIYDFKTGVRDKTLMLMNYLFPIGFFLLVGLFMTKINPAFKDIMIPGMILFTIMSTTLLSLPGTMVAQRNAGIYRGFRVNGVPAGSLIVIPLLGCLFHTALASGLITLGSLVLFDGAAPVYWGRFVLVFLLSSLALASLGTLLGIVAQSSRASTLLAQAFYIPSVLLGGLMVPAAMMPESMTAISSLFPATHGVRAFTSWAFTAGTVPDGAGVPVIVLAASLVINLTLSFLLFQWDTRPERKGKLFLAFFALAPFAVGMLVNLEHL